MQHWQNRKQRTAAYVQRLLTTHPDLPDDVKHQLLRLGRHLIHSATTVDQLKFCERTFLEHTHWCRYNPQALLELWTTTLTRRAA